MKLTKKESTKIINSLPTGWAKMIHDRLEAAITIRHIRNILNGQFDDAHGVINIALQLIEEHKKQSNQLKKAISSL